MTHRFATSFARLVRLSGLVVALGALTLAGCTGGPAAATATAAATTAAPVEATTPAAPVAPTDPAPALSPAPSPAATVDPAFVVARVNGQTITYAHYRKLARFVAYQAQSQGADVSAEELGKAALDQAIDDVLIRGEASRRGIAITPERLTARVEELFGYYREPGKVTPQPTPITPDEYRAQYAEWLARLDEIAGMTEQDFRALVESDLLREELYQAVTGNLIVTAEQVHARHILIGTGDFGPHTDEEALALANEVLAKLEAGEDFAAMAGDYSDDAGTADIGGDLGWFARDQGLEKAFEDATFALQAGERSKPVKTPFGYHIIEVLARENARQLDEWFVDQKKLDAYETWLQEVRDAASIESNWTPALAPAPAP